MICTHCLQRKAEPPTLCPCKVKDHVHVICASCAERPDSIAAVNAAWMNPTSRERIERTLRAVGDLVFRCDPWGNA